jgi:hypothetical protein
MQSVMATSISAVKVGTEEPALMRSAMIRRMGVSGTSVKSVASPVAWVGEYPVFTLAN